MKVKNINGTSQNNCKCGSWLQHWKNYSGQTRYVCTVRACLNTDLSGAHVQKNVARDHAWYIVPLCSQHNQARGTLDLVEGIQLVSANQKETCG